MQMTLQSYSGESALCPCLLDPRPRLQGTSHSGSSLSQRRCGSQKPLKSHSHCVLDGCLLVHGHQPSAAAYSQLNRTPCSQALRALQANFWPVATSLQPQVLEHNFSSRISFIGAPLVDLEELALRDAVLQVAAHLGALGSSQRWNEVVRPALLRQLQIPVEEIVCYALGQPQDPGFFWQIALLLLMANTFIIPSEKRLVFDPLHGPLEKRIIAACGLTATERSEHAAVKCQTIFYLPFAPYDLADNVVRANLYNLARIAIVGNDLRWFVDSEWRNYGKPRPSQGRAPSIEAALLAILNATTLFEGDVTAGFSNTSLPKHSFKEPNCLNATLTSFRSFRLLPILLACVSKWNTLQVLLPIVLRLSVSFCLAIIGINAVRVL